MDKIELGKQLLGQMPSDMQCFVPTKEDIAILGVGAIAVDCFGKIKLIREIFCRGNDTTGRAYICYYTQFSENSKISMSIKENELVRTMPLCNKFKSFELNAIEAYLVSRKG
jgi:hypothetical protein